MTGTRRGHGEGSIFRRSDGRWAGQVDLGWRDGKRQRKTVYASTRREVADKIRKASTAHAAGLTLPNERRTTGDYLSWWVTKVAPDTVKPSTRDGYEWLLDRYVIPSIGKVPLARLGPQHVHDMLTTLEERGLAPRTRRQARAILRRALGQAERFGFVARNAAALTDAPRLDARVQTDDALTLDEARALLDAAADTRLSAFVTLTLALGLRRGEALALKWEHVDFDAGMLTVSGTLKRRKGHGLFVDSQKTEAGRRTIPLPTFCVDALRDHATQQKRERLAAGPAWADTGYVFVSPVGTPIDPARVWRDFQGLCDAAGIRRRPVHALRHSAATLMLARGVPLEVISKTLGHAGYSVTADVYARVGASLQRHAADAMNEALSDGR